MPNNKYYGYTPKYSNEEKRLDASAEFNNRLDRVNPYEFRKGMDIELAELGCSRLRESSKEEREKATEKVLKNLESTPNYYTSLITYESLFKNVEGSKPSFSNWMKTQENVKMQEVNRGDKDSKHKDDKMTEPKYDKKEYTIPLKTQQKLKENKLSKLKNVIKERIKNTIIEQSAKQAAMADIEDEEGAPKKSKGKGKAKANQKEKPIRKDRFDKEEEAIKDILFRVDAKGKKPKEEGDYTKDEPAPGSMLAVKDEMLDKYKELKADETDPKQTLEEYNKLLAEKNEEFKEAIEKFVEEFSGNGISMADIYGDKLSDTIKSLQERLKLGLNKARAGVEVEARGMRREVAESQMTREEALRLLEIVKEKGISLREGTENVKIYYEIAKAAYLEGVANALNL
tara:strand:+ start:433 stop:1632 length:1200 start_codon:yes stop_codon:yes gene_type:complete